MNIDAKLVELGLELPQAPKPIAAYVPAVRTGNLVFVSGQLPLKDGQLLATGPVTQDIDIAKTAAAQCVLNGLAILKNELNGDWSKFVRVVRIGVFVQTSPGYERHAEVANGASELLQQIFGQHGCHARAAIGCPTLPLNAMVEIEFVFEVR